MCVLAFAWKAHPRWHLVLAGNRDELHARPAVALARWDDHDGLIAGRDLQSGGTWLGVSEQDRLAVVTNLRGFGLPDPERASRGAIITDYLAGAGKYADPAQAALQDFNPFNLILADSETAQFLSNRPRDIRSALAPGIYGLSNGALDEPWPKTLQIKAGMLDWLIGDAEKPAVLLELLAQEYLPTTGLPAVSPSDIPLEAQQSPIFIRHALYGTRCSTVVAIDKAGAGTIIERRYDDKGRANGETRIAFDWR